MTKKVKVNKYRRLELSRRQVVKVTGAAAVAAALPTILTPRKAMAAIKITVRDPGGPYVDAFSEAYYKPFNEMMKGEIVATGVAGKHEPTAQIKSMVDTGSYTWDMAHLSISAHNLLRDAGYLTKLEIEDNPDVQEIPEHFRTPYLLGVDVYTTILAYRSVVGGCQLGHRQHSPRRDVGQDPGSRPADRRRPGVAVLVGGHLRRQSRRQHHADRLRLHPGGGHDHPQA